MRVLGIDPGTYNMGIGVVSSNGSSMTMDYLDILSPSRKYPLPKRLGLIYEELSRIVKDWSPGEVAIEQPFAGQNIKAAMAIGQAQAVAMVVAARNDIPVSSYAPRSVKQAVTDYGGSSKEQVQEMIRVLLELEETPSTDAADALAVAICHINSSYLGHLNIHE